MKYLFWLAILPSVVLCFLIYQVDSIEKEPKKELLKAFLLGILAITFTLFFTLFFPTSYLEIDSQNFYQIILYSFLAVAFVEEFSKWILSYLFLRKNPNFDYLLDGIVYVSFLSLGFATIENILYTMTGGFETAIFRAITTVPAHVFFGIYSGYYFSLGKQTKEKNQRKKAKKYLLYSFLFPWLLHGFYDFCLLTKNNFFFFLFLIFLSLLYSISILKVKKIRKTDYRFSKQKNSMDS